MIKLRNLVIIIIILIIVLFALLKLGVLRTLEIDFVQKINRILIGNEMIVNASSEIDLMKIKINSANSINSVFVDGEFLDNIGNISNGPKFDVFYENILIGKALHSNSKDWYVNKFEFKFFRQKKEVKFTFSSRGNNKHDSYIWITKVRGKSIYQSFDSDGKPLMKWTD